MGVGPRQPSDRQLLLGYSLLTLLLGAALLLSDGSSNLMILLIGPVIYAAFVSARRIYLVMLVIASLGSALVIWGLSSDVSSSLVTLGLLMVAVLVTSEAIFRHNAARARLQRKANLHSSVFITLGKQLNEVTTTQEAAQVIAAAADQLLGWDACIFEIYHAEEGLSESVLRIDTINGARQHFKPPTQSYAPSPFMRRAITEGALLIARDEQELSDTEGVLFGNTSRRSATLMFVPVRSGALIMGMLSIQSYTPRAYGPQDLDTLQALADYCGGRLERLRVELAVSQQEARYRAISELTSDYIFAAILRPDGAQQTEWLTEGAFTRITGYTAASYAANGDWDALIHPDDRSIARRRAQRLLAGHPDISELRILTADGDARWLRAYTRPIADNQDERGWRILGAVQDITTSKQAEEALLHRQKLESLGVLAGGIAHDFNNLLTVILGNAELAAQELRPDSLGGESIDQLRRAAKRASELTQQMLAYSGRGRFVIGPVDVNAVAGEMLSLLGASLSKQIALVSRLAMALPPVEGDASQLNQLVLNLIVNASEAIGDRAGSITVTTRLRELDLDALGAWRRYDELAPGPYVFLEVNDTGSGMDSATQARIFDPFFSTKFTGRGLGLAVVMGVVRSHHGALQVLSEPGQGTSFRVILPALQGAAPIASAAPPVERSKPLAGRTVLIIDDEASVRTLAARLVERAGGNALQAADGVAGLALTEAHAELYCVLLDLTMPQLSGEQVLAALGARRPDLPVILMSGYDAEELRVRFADAAVAAFLQKPFTQQELHGVLAQARKG
jgi:PAS domain S-box-containing protein